MNHLLDTADHHAGGQSRTLMPSDVAVVCPHVAQAAAVRAALADHPSVLVGTAHQLQGLERPAVIALHPMVGYRTAEDTALDTGKACVMLSRHRTHLTVITDTASRPLLTHADDPRAAPTPPCSTPCTPPPPPSCPTTNQPPTAAPPQCQHTGTPTPMRACRWGAAARRRFVSGVAATVRHERTAGPDQPP